MTRVVLASETDWDGWRRATRALVLGGAPPEAILWSVGADDSEGDPMPVPSEGSFGVSRALVALAETAILARDPERFALLYGLVWRAHRGERHVFQQATDPELRRAQGLARSVRRDMHRMRALLRFRVVERADGTWHVGWFEPDHHILEANAGFLARRFPTLRWSILTPGASAHWDGKRLRLGPGVDPDDVPDDDTLEACWRNLPDPAALSEVTRPASGWTEDILEQPLREPDKLPLGPVRLRSRQSGPAARNTPLARAAHDAESCRRCDLWGPATQTVFGEGPADARVMFVGEQPGDQEDVAGRPFVGPAGQLLDRALEEAGIDRRTVYVTNAVKHFKFVPRGKRRIHQKPEGPEIAACKFWLDIELREVQPDLVVLLGATAARAALGRTVTIGRERGRRIELPDGQAAFVTVHPSFLLRVPDEEGRAREYRAFVDDLRKVARLAAEIAG
ncbi:MAG: UdgX family uracil-DNA binding protein [Afipia sp.]|nr:UdgX family uracil-DNA binding protein [Afipia sp.]